MSLEQAAPGPPTLRWAGLVAWLAAGLPVAMAAWSYPPTALRPHFPLFLAAFATFGAVFMRLSGVAGARATTANRALAFLMTGAGLLCIYLFPQPLAGVALGGALLVVVAAVLIPLVPKPVALAWIGAQTLILVLIYVAGARWPWQIASFTAAAYLGLQLFAVLVAQTAFMERESRLALARAHAELRAAHTLLDETSRAAERVRIARELHDILGHHLAALSLNLDVARRSISGPAAEAVQRAHTIARLLLADVRDAVHAERAERPIDLAAAIRALAAGIPEPRVQIDVAPDFVLTHGDDAHALLRVAQEALTNVVLHAGARNVSVSLRPTADMLELAIRDDGRGAAELRRGHGLTAMRARLEQAGGRLSLHTSPGGGFEVVASVPRRGESP